MPSLAVNGLNSITTTANITGLNATTGVTISWWQRSLPDAGGTDNSMSGTIINQSSSANLSRDGYCIGWDANGRIVSRIHGSANTTATTAVILPQTRAGMWNHFIFSFEASSTQVCYYVNGKMAALQTNTRVMTANAACQTTISATGVGGTTIYGYIFDLQVAPNYVVPEQDAIHLMNPLEGIPEVKGRYFGVQSRHGRWVSTDPLRDESGSGNNLTYANGPVFSGPEPPFRFTIA